MLLSMGSAHFKGIGIQTASRYFMLGDSFQSPEGTSCRIRDLITLTFEFMLNSPSSERAMKAIARTNYVHAYYQKPGRWQLLNSDLLYMLSVLALEPVRWINAYEWRNLTEPELCAIGTFWKDLGDAMLIPYDELSSARLGWSDGLHWLGEIQDWSLRYERHQMVPSDLSHKAMKIHFDMLAVKVPTRIARMAMKFVSVGFGKRLREAFLLPEPHPIYFYLFHGLSQARRLFLRHLMLPRPEFLRKQLISPEPDSKTGLYTLKIYITDPWWIKSSFMGRWGPRAWPQRLLGRKLPGDDVAIYEPEGYDIAEVGPPRFKGKGTKEMEATKRRLIEQRRGGCPFGVS